MENGVVKMENGVVEMVGFALMTQEKWHKNSLGLRVKGECGRADARHTVTGKVMSRLPAVRSTADERNHTSDTMADT